VQKLEEEQELLKRARVPKEDTTPYSRSRGYLDMSVKSSGRPMEPWATWSAGSSARRGSITSTMTSTITGPEEVSTTNIAELPSRAMIMKIKIFFHRSTLHNSPQQLLSPFPPEFQSKPKKFSIVITENVQKLSLAIAAPRHYL
jgi:hypothetical protein